MNARRPLAADLGLPPKHRKVFCSACSIKRHWMQVGASHLLPCLVRASLPIFVQFSQKLSIAEVLLGRPAPWKRAVRRDVSHLSFQLMLTRMLVNRRTPTPLPPSQRLRPDSTKGPPRTCADLGFDTIVTNTLGSARGLENCRSQQKRGKHVHTRRVHGDPMPTTVAANRHATSLVSKQSRGGLGKRAWPQ